MKAGLRAMTAVLGAVCLSAICGSAYAACPTPLTGKWHMTMVANYPNGAFVESCAMTIQANGNYSATCKSRGLGESATTSDTITGILKADAKCEISGLMRTAGKANSAVLNGYVNGNQATFTAFRDSPATQVRTVVLIKNY